MNAQWIDFKALREQLDFTEVLRRHGVELKRKDRQQHQAFCPLPGHNGQRKSPSFSVNLERKIFKCFGCNRGGNVLDFCVYMAGKNPDDRRAVREVALKLREEYGLATDAPPQQQRDNGAPPPDRRHKQLVPSVERRSSRSNDGGAHEKAERASTRPATLINAPLDFELKGLDPKHPYLRERGYSDETIMHFGLGFCNRGLMQGRVVIPLKDDAGRLIGYAGRFTRDDQVGPAVPKYLFPSNRERNGTVLEFRKSKFLYGGHALGKDPVDDLVVVEGFPSVWWLWQWGFTNVVALMGNSCSEEQANLIVRHTIATSRVWLMPDAGEGGDLCADSLFAQVAPHRFCRWVRLDDGQPTDRSSDELANLLDGEAVRR